MVIYNHFIFIGVKGKIAENGIKRRINADVKSSKHKNGYVTNRSVPKMNNSPPVDYVAIDLEEDRQEQIDSYTEPSFEVLLPRTKQSIEICSPKTTNSRMNMIAEEEIIDITDKEFETPSERLEKIDVKSNKDDKNTKPIFKVQKSYPKKFPSPTKSHKQILISFNAAPDRKTYEPSINKTPYSFDVRASQGNGTSQGNDSTKNLTMKTHKIPPSGISRKVTCFKNNPK
jgi:hypothetical protein